MNLSKPLSRRTVLRGLGTAVALPVLEAMIPRTGLAGTAARDTPRRLAFFYVPNGVHVPDWTPTAVGKNYTVPYILEPLSGLKNDLTVLTGLTLDKARDHGDGAGDHARAMSSFLTGRHPRKTHGADIRAGISADQVAARKIGKFTRFASLELGCDRGMQFGSCDSGYSCAYSANLSWRSESTPMAKEVSPRLVFERLFSDHRPGESAKGRERRLLSRRSILDYVADDAGRLRVQLGAADRRKVDEYLEGVRELETRLGRAEEDGEKVAPFISLPTGIPKDYTQHVRLMMDLLALAFQADLTRVATFVFANDGSNRSYRFIGIPEGHHDLSHHQGKKEKQDKVRQINHFHITQWAYLLDKLKKIPDGEGTLLDQCMLVYGSGISDGNAHNHDNLPILLAGRGGGTIAPGWHIRYPRETPLANLYLSLLDRVGAPVDSFGDSTGQLKGL